MEKLLTFFFDKSTSIGFRTAMAITILSLLVVTDLCLNITYNIGINNQIEQLDKLQSLKTSYSSDSLKLSKILNIEDEILNKHHYSDYLRFEFLLTSKKSKTKDQKDNETRRPNNVRNPIVSRFWMVISANYSLLILWPVLIFLPLAPNQEKRAGGWIFGWIAMNVIWVALITLVTLIAYQIPIIWGNPTYNYWLNALIHTLTLGIPIAVVTIRQNR